MESPGIGSSQVAVLEDAQPLDFFDVSKNSWELRVSAEETIEERFLEIPDVAFCVVFLVYLSKALDFLKISSRSETGVVGGPFGFSLVLGLLEDTLYQWSHQIDDYNHNNFQAFPIMKAWIYVISQGSLASISSPWQ